MRILLCGATGYIGAEVLDQLIKHNYVTHIYCLTRKTLAPKYSTHPKVTQVIHEDFGEYPNYLIERLASYGIEACIWCLGHLLKKFKSKDEAEKVEVHYPLRAAEAFAKGLATELDPKAPPNKQKFPFRFIFTSCWGAEQNQFRTLWIWSDSRKLKGAAEKGLFEIADNSLEIDGKRCFEVVSLRPGTVIAGGDAITTIMSEATVPCIAVDRLAKRAIRVCMQGSGDKRILENRDCLGEDWAMVNSLNI